MQSRQFVRIDGLRDGFYMKRSQYKGARFTWYHTHRLNRMIRREAMKAYVDCMRYGTGAVTVDADAKVKHLPYLHYRLMEHAVTYGEVIAPVRHVSREELECMYPPQPKENDMETTTEVCNRPTTLMRNCELPLYQCHKKVRASKILSIEPVGENGRYLIKLDVNQSEVGKKIYEANVNQDWFNKHNPEVGGYFVRYEDGYLSYSPKEAFESGYTAIKEEPETGEFARPNT